MSTTDSSGAAAGAPIRKTRRRNADYRWTMPKVVAFLEALATCGRVAEAAAAVGMSRQSVYRLRTRLERTRFAAAFEGARRQGLRARVAESARRLRSQWDGPGLAEMARLWAAQGDAANTQAAAAAAQGDAPGPQGDASTRKAAQERLDTVTV